MPAKEDRSDWVAVEPEFQVTAATVRRATSAYQFFQKDAAAIIAREHGKVSDIAEHSRLVQEQWKALTPAQRAKYHEQHELDVERYERESAAADAAAFERTRELQQKRDQIYDVGGDPSLRLTRKKLQKHQRKEYRRKAGDDSDAASESDDEKEIAKKKKPRVFSQKQQEYRNKLQQEKREKEEYIAGRQETLRKERSAQAKRRLEFLLSQGGNIFSHFGSVKEDTMKYGIKKTDRKEGDVARHASDEDEDLDEADEHEATFLSAQPSTLGFGTMRPYQLEGLNWMIRLQENGVNGILADEMGLGKTLQSISVLVYMLEHQNVNGPHLIVVPKSTLSNWMNEIKRWAPTLKGLRFHGDKAMREEIVRTSLEPAQRDDEREWHVCVTTYEICNIEKNVLGKFAWNYLIIDEAHRLKNEASSFSKTVRQFETRYRLLLTGTPLQNSLHELWALLNFLVPDVFESSDQFDEWFNLDIDDNHEKNKLISQLHKILRPFMLRRLKADVEKSLPPKHETILFTGMSAMQKKLYRDILIRDIDAVQGTSGSRTAILNIVMQLRKAAGHPYLFPGVEDRSLPPLGEHLVENCGKMVVLDKLLNRMRERGHRVLLFTQMTKILDIMEDYLFMRKFPYCRIDGKTSHEDREGYIDSFNAPNSEKFIFLLSTRAGGLGINLQTADVVILYDSDWNPQADLQAQDRAHRIGQKKPVQVFRLVTEHTIEEKIVERAQQKLKLDAMVVQQGRLKEKDNLSRDELLHAVRFGADKIFKSKDSSVTDDDIDLILDAGKRKTEELNEKLKAADKGDLLDFKFDGSSAQTFEGVDYSNSVLAQAKAEAEMMGIFDIGKRERKEANYNENSLYQRQVALHSSSQNRPKKAKSLKLPRNIRLPRLEEWQMYDRQTLMKIQEEEEVGFRSLPEEQQKLALSQPKGQGENEGDRSEDVPFELPPLLSNERKAEKEKLLAEGFSGWKRHDYTTFVKLSSKYGRKNAMPHIAAELGKPEVQVQEFMDAFWGELGKSRIAEHEYDRAVKLIERGEKKIEDIAQLERGTRVLIAHFNNPWKELEFTHVNCKDKQFTAEEDRYLLCWARKFGYGQWQAVRLAIRRHPQFRFDYFLRSLPVELVGRRCEQLMKAAEKEVEQLEKYTREENGMSSDPSHGELAPVQLPKFHVLQNLRQVNKREKAAKERKELEDKVSEITAQMQSIQNRLKELSEGASYNNVHEQGKVKKPVKNEACDDVAALPNGAQGPGGKYMEFPPYDGKEEPLEWKKPFTHFCIKTRKEVKASLDSAQRKDKKRVNGLLKEKWHLLSNEDKVVWREWTEWDKKRCTRDNKIYQSQSPDVGSKKRKAESTLANKAKKR